MPSNGSTGTLPGSLFDDLKQLRQMKDRYGEDFEKMADIAAGSSETWPVSAAHCGDDGFIVSPPKYACRVPTMDTAKAE